MSEVTFQPAEEAVNKFLGTLKKENYYLDIVETGETWEAWVYGKDESTKRFADSCMKKQGAHEFSFAGALATFEDNFDTYIEDYETDVAILVKEHFNRTVNAPDIEGAEAVAKVQKDYRAIADVKNPAEIIGKLNESTRFKIAVAIHERAALNEMLGLDRQSVCTALAKDPNAKIRSLMVDVGCAEILKNDKAPVVQAALERHNKKNNLDI